VEHDPPVVEKVGPVLVVRDDLVEGGTKRPALASVLPTWGGHEVAYPAASGGMGQVALALACADTGRQAVVFVAERRRPTKQTAWAAEVGARIVWVPHGYYSVVQARARQYADFRGARYLPPGLAHPDFEAAVAARARSLQLRPEVVVVTVGSGTLCRGLMAAWPGAQFIAVRVGMRPHCPGAQVVDAPEAYTQPALRPPPFPSAREQDAKAWRFVPQRPGVLFWNIAA
jgi:Pyridoxal-phosphate dependent enzyme